MSDPKNAFPRGLVLGLTMAESAILIVFVLLLAMTVLITRESDRRKAAEGELERYNEIRCIMEEYGLGMDGLLHVLSTYRDDQRDAGNWRELVRQSALLVPKRTPEAIVRELEEGRKARDRTKGGGGTDHPSCWYDDDGSVAYLFDIALTDNGFVLKEAQSPQHRRERALLPLDDVVTSRTLTTEQFLAQTRPVFQSSVNNAKECRFFVRAFDHTAPSQKELYKNRMRHLESRFYKNANPSGPSPFSGPAPPLP